jgi:hypothetical protein
MDQSSEVKEKSIAEEDKNDDEEATHSNEGRSRSKCTRSWSHHILRTYQSARGPANLM